ncbi:ShlB/FhaC/HecB family hemolysin secretion/activation protein (plasmid) [Paraburkholderia sp. PREW-6R]|uniref:ShlB/FhaC/HecB family hemolysin secretion/activation protein n=1 Tax=Paraburkholderia sp. PREW-6R TaxID=3141544 RepID=UPI0031F5D9CC
MPNPKSMWWISVLVAAEIILLAVIVSPVFAQTPPALPFAVPVRPVQDPAQLLIDQQREQAAQRKLNQPPATVSLPPSTPGTSAEVPPDTPVDQIAETGPVFRIHHIDVQGNTVLPPSRINAITSAFVDHDIGSRRTNVLLQRLTDAFVSAGYITTRAYLGAQNLGSGTLTITVEVGRVGGYTLNGETLHRLAPGEKSVGGGWLTDAGYENAFPGSTGDPLRLENLNEGVSQVNRLRRNQAEVQILPGQSPGDSLIAISNQPGDRLYYTLGADNYGSEATGVMRYRAGVEADNLIGLQESISLSYVDSLDSNAVVGSIAVPFGRHTFSYTVSDSEYQQLVETTAVMYGRTLSHIFGWNYALANTSSDAVSSDTTLSWRRTDREVNDIELDPQHIAVLRAGGTWLHKFVMNDTPANVTLNAGISQGLPWFEAVHDAGRIAKADAHSQFTKLDATATFTLPLPVLSTPVGPAAFAYRGVLGGQFTNVALFGSEQLYLGGMDTVRGFRSGEIVGDRGFYSRNEIALVNVPSWHDGRIEPYLFFDAGKASLVAVGGFPSLVGTGAGLRAQWQWHRQLLSAEAMLGRALTQPVSLGPIATLFLFTLNWNY